MNYKMIAVDLDGTLLENPTTLSKGNELAIKTAIKKGITVVLCTGRPVGSAYPFVKKLGLDKVGGYYIAYHGGRIYDATTNEIVYKEELTKQQIQALFSLSAAKNIHVHTYHENEVVSLDDGPDMQQYIEDSGKANLSIRKITEIEEVDFNSPKVLCIAEPEVLIAFREDIEKWAKTQPNIHCFFSNVDYLETMQSTTSKGLAIEKIANKIGISMDEVIAIGDGENDISMIKKCGLGVAMANARDCLKEVADYITEKDNTKDGVAEVIEKFILRGDK